MTTFKRTNSQNPDLPDLIKLLDEDLQIRDGPEHSFYAQFNKLDNIQHVVICYSDDIAIGCGAFKPYDQQCIEVKRMFVMLEYRGKSIGLHILNELEMWAAELNYTSAILETGNKQPEAIRLYEKAGYKIIENFGQYKNVQNSVCMARDF